MRELATLSCAMIVKNAEDHLEKTIGSLPRGIFKEIVIADTGSRDDTEKIARRLATKFIKYEDPDPIYIDGEPYLGDFSRARNVTFDACSGDYIFWIDSDDILWNPAGFIAFYRDVISQGEVDGVWMWYDYNHDAKGNCILRQGRERIVKRDTHVWRSPIHEVLCAHYQINGVEIPLNESRIIHDVMSTEEKAHKSLRNCLVAEHWIKKLKGDVEARMWLNYGNALCTLERFEEAIDAYSKYLERSEWNGERYHAFLSTAECQRKLGHPEDAIDSIMKAVRLVPEFREAYIELANSMLDLGEYENALLWAEHAETRDKNNMDYKGNPYFLHARPTEIKVFANLHLGKLKESVKEADNLLKHFPGHHGILAQKALCQNMIREKAVEESWRVIERLVVNEEDDEKLANLRNAIPRMLETSPRVAAPVRIETKPGQPTLCLLCGEAMKPWGYDSIEKGGVGGSETAVILLTEQLAALGWHVEVYGYPAPDQEGFHRGVWWFPYWRIQNTRNFDVFVNWRTNAVITKMPPHKAAYVWLHDVQMQYHWHPRILEHYDEVIVLSDAHRRNVEDFIPEEKLWVSRNGLDPSFWDDPGAERGAHRLIYASCPSRGLHLFLPRWQEVLDQFPDAELEIYYGFNKHFLEHAKVSERFRNIYRTVMDGIKQKGISFHGMVDQKTLSKAFWRANLWAYPCPFPEISCITAMQAQATGAFPITTKYWALNETVQYGTKVGHDHEDNIEDRPTLMTRWIEALLTAMRGKGTTEHRRKEMMAWAQTTFPWAAVAKEWDEHFRQRLGISQREEVPQLTTSAS